MIGFRNKIIWIAVVTFLVTSVPWHPAAAITITAEEKLSKEFMREVSKQFTFIEDPVLVNYVNAVGKRIAAKLPAHPYQFRFFLVKQDGYNAFAGPGGVIFLFSDLMIAMESPSELAGILAHEMMHVISRHISDRVERSKQIGIVTLAGLVAAIALGAAGEGSAANALMVGSVAAGQSIALAYSREDEMQADQLGLKILTQAGYSPAGLVTVMKKIRQTQWFGTRQVPTYLRTHPASEERIAYIEAWMERQSELPPPLPVQDQVDFDWVRMRMRALYAEQGREMAIMADEVEMRPMDPLAHYGYGLLLARAGRHDEAVDHLKQALAQRLFDARLLVDLGRIYFLSGRFDDAVKTLNGAMAIDSADPDGLYYLGRVHLALNRADKAILFFKRLLGNHIDHRDLHYFVGQAYGQSGNLEEAYYHLGRHCFKKGKIVQAITQLEKALQISTQAERREEIEVLLNQLRAERAEQRAKKSSQ